MEEHVIIGGSVDKTTATLTQSPITSVTVHKSGAVITRTLRLLLEASPENATRRHSGHEVIVYGLPACADPESLRVSGDGNAIIMDTSLRPSYEIPVGRGPTKAAAADGVEPTGVSASDLAGRLELAQAEEERVRAAGARLEEEGYLLRNWAAATLYGGGDGGGGGGRNGAQQQAPPLVGISTVQAALDFVRARRTALDDELAAVRKAQRKAAEAVAALRAQLSESGARDRAAPQYDAAPNGTPPPLPPPPAGATPLSFSMHLKLVSKRPAAAAAASSTAEAEPMVIRFSYLVRRAGWEPSYMLSLSSGEKTMGVLFKAHVRQATGEAWEGVQLRLAGSNAADESAAGAPPKLKPLRYVAVYDAAAQAGGKALHRSGLGSSRQQQAPTMFGGNGGYGAQQQQGLPSAFVGRDGGSNISSFGSSVQQQQQQALQAADWFAPQEPVQQQQRPAGPFAYNAMASGPPPRPPLPPGFGTMMPHGGAPDFAAAMMAPGFGLSIAENAAGDAIDVGAVAAAAPTAATAATAAAAAAAPDAGGGGGGAASDGDEDDDIYDHARGGSPPFGGDGPSELGAPSEAGSSALLLVPPLDVLSASVVKGLLGAQFDISGPVDVPSDDATHIFQVTELSLPVELTYLAVPVAAGHAFVRATAENTSDVPLLAGPAAVYVDGMATVRRAALPWTPPGQKVVLNSGADHDVSASTEEPATTSKIEGDVAKFRRFTISRRVTVTSKKAVAVRLLVRDQIPVVEAAAPYNVDCKVRLVEPKHGTLPKHACGSASYDPRTGYVEWSLTLQAGDKAVLPLRYEIDATLNARLTKAAAY